MQPLLADRSCLALSPWTQKSPRPMFRSFAAVATVGTHWNAGDAKRLWRSSRRRYEPLGIGPIFRACSISGLLRPASRPAYPIPIAATTTLPLRTTVRPVSWLYSIVISSNFRNVRGGVIDLMALDVERNIAVIDDGRRTGHEERVDKANSRIFAPANSGGRR